LDFSPNGQYLASGGADRTVWIWDFKEDQIYRLAVEHRDAVTAVAFSPDKTMLMTGSMDRRIKLVMNF
jgi:WD40 repeat protein